MSHARRRTPSEVTIPGVGRGECLGARRERRQGTTPRRHGAGTADRPVGHRDVPSWRDRKSTRLNSSHSQTSYAVFCLNKKKKKTNDNNNQKKKTQNRQTKKYANVS